MSRGSRLVELFERINAARVAHNDALAAGNKLTAYAHAVSVSVLRSRAKRILSQ